MGALLSILFAASIHEQDGTGDDLSLLSSPNPICNLADTSLIISDKMIASAGAPGSPNQTTNLGSVPNTAVFGAYQRATEHLCTCNRRNVKLRVQRSKETLPSFLQEVPGSNEPVTSAAAAIDQFVGEARRHWRFTTDLSYSSPSEVGELCASNCRNFVGSQGSKKLLKMYDEPYNMGYFANNPSKESLGSIAFDKDDFARASPFTSSPMSLAESQAGSCCAEKMSSRSASQQSLLQENGSHAGQGSGSKVKEGTMGDSGSGRTRNHRRRRASRARTRIQSSAKGGFGFWSRH